MRGVFTRGLFFLAIFGTLFLYWGLVERKTNQLLPEFAGCFRGPGTLSSTNLVVTTNGTIQLYGSTIQARLTQDKVSYSFLPSKAILFDTSSPTKLIVASTPMLLRISADRQSLTVPGNGPGAIFRREKCRPAVER